MENSGACSVEAVPNTAPKDVLGCNFHNSQPVLSLVPWELKQLSVFASGGHHVGEGCSEGCALVAHSDRLHRERRQPVAQRPGVRRQEEDGKAN